MILCLRTKHVRSAIWKRTLVAMSLQILVVVKVILTEQAGRQTDRQVGDDAIWVTRSSFWDATCAAPEREHRATLIHIISWFILLLLFCIDKTYPGVSHIGVATPWDDCPYPKSNTNTFVCARAHKVFLTSCATSGTFLGACGTLRMSPRLIPPYSVGKPYTNSPPSSIVTFFT